ncbi:MAG: hypothetical protein GY737_29295, partial [Desulfobacteraceae bacterium]|nr:hypothetical protein [Desulfobacteraceae bacterium]
MKISWHLEHKRRLLQREGCLHKDIRALVTLNLHISRFALFEGGFLVSVLNKSKGKQSRKQAKRVTKAAKRWDDAIRAVEEGFARKQAGRTVRGQKERWAEVTAARKELKWAQAVTILKRIEHLGAQIENEVQTNGQSKKFWEMVTEKKGVDLDLRDQSGEIITDIKHQTELIRQYFIKLFNDKEAPHPQDRKTHARARLSTSMAIWDRPFTTDEIAEALRRKSNSAAGMDGLPPKILKVLGSIDLTIMQEILNAILETGVFPRELVMEKATIIPKSCKAEGPKDTRMISVANSLNGLLSALISARLRGALEPHLDDGIGGCRPGRGCLDQIAAVKYATVNAHLEGKVIIASLTDMSKFFDTIGNDLAETLLIKFL